MSTAITFGKFDHLIGVLEKSDKNLPLVLMWNVGVISRSGPYRQQTELAEKLKSLGFPSFRFDVGGRGDSKIRSDISEDFERSVTDALEALNLLKEKYGYKQFIVYGHCSSAVEGHIIASLCPEVVGLSMIDTYSYRVGKFQKQFYQNRLLSASRLAAAAKKRIVKKPDAEKDQDLFEGFYPELEDLSEHIDGFIKRNLPMYVHYTGGFEFIYNYEDQFLDMFPQLRNYDKLDLYLQKDADHLFSTLESRKILNERVISWFKSNFKENKSSPDRNLRDLFRRPLKSMLTKAALRKR